MNCDTIHCCYCHTIERRERSKSTSELYGQSSDLDSDDDEKDFVDRNVGSVDVAESSNPVLSSGDHNAISLSREFGRISNIISKEICREVSNGGYQQAITLGSILATLGDRYLSIYERELDVKERELELRALQFEAKLSKNEATSSSRRANTKYPNSSSRGYDV